LTFKKRIMQFDQELNKIQLESVLSHNFFENLMWPRFLKTAVIENKNKNCSFRGLNQEPRAKV
jgi:hypothetical protein